jgi:hypothetical protein
LIIVPINHVGGVNDYSAIEHFTRPETTPGDIVALCQTQPDSLDNITNMQVNAIVLYVGQSIALMRNAWQAIGGR